MSSRFQPKWLRIERRAAASQMAREILQRYPELPVEYVEDWKTQAGRGPHINARYGYEKNGLMLAVKDGALVKQVDRDQYRPTPGEYYIIHAMGCPFDCEYCFLFDYLDHQIPTLFVNTEDILREILAIVAANSTAGSELLFHAGEFSDALAFDHLTNLSMPLVDQFAQLTNARLELRTKSDNVANLLTLTHRGRTTVSWTFSPEENVRHLEHGTAKLSERITAAKLCQQAGYPIGLRLDPIVYDENWENGYRELIAKIFAKIDPEGVQDCSLGIYRATPRLRHLVRRRFPRSRLHVGEMEQADDGKYRYLRPLRVHMLQTIVAMLRAHAPNLRIALCMEPDAVAQNLRPMLG